MQTVKIEKVLEASVQDVWAVFSDVTRCDWVPAVDAITEKDGVRSFTMEGIGEVQERILKLDHDAHCLQYSAIKTPNPLLGHHLATIQLTASGEHCLFSWTTEIEPDEFAPAIEHGMSVSFDGLLKVLGL